MNLTFEQEQQQDLVNNAVHSYLCDKAGNPDLPWDIEKIAEVREEWQEIICDRLNMTTPFQFYPWLLEEGDTDENLYRVSLIQAGEDVLCTLFNCEADDEDDARRQAHEEYPGCRVLTIYPW